MLPTSRRRPWALVAASAVLLPGCAGVHSRQWGYPNGSGRLAEIRKGLGRSPQGPAPQVRLRVEALPEDRGTARNAGD